MIETKIYDYFKTLFGNMEGSTATPIMGNYSADMMSDIVKSKLTAGVPAVLYTVQEVVYQDLDTMGELRNGRAVINVWYGETSLKTAEFPHLLPEVLANVEEIDKYILLTPIEIPYEISFRLLSRRCISNDANGTVYQMQYELPGLVLDYEEI